MRSDNELLAAWREGDAQAGKELFERHFASLRRFFANKVDLHEVEDLMQRSFMGCVEAVDRFRGDSSFRTFLFAIGRRQLYKHFRDQRVKDGRRADDLSVTSVAELGRTPSSMMGAQQEEALMLRALQRISVDHQTVLELHYWEQLSTEEIAQVCDVAPGTIRTRLHRARNALRVAFEADLKSRGRSLDELDVDAAAVAARP
ncbi:MAG: RNA polymerase sigma factor [Nannocystaceae bacterium]|nr:RNA polymerase sigma factor [Nannocystaceae bacterium]